MCIYFPRGTPLILITLEILTSKNTIIMRKEHQTEVVIVHFVGSVVNLADVTQPSFEMKQRVPSIAKLYGGYRDSTRARLWCIFFIRYYRVNS